MIHPIEISVFRYKTVVFHPDKDSELVDLPDKAVPATKKADRQAGKFWFVFNL